MAYPHRWQHYSAICELVFGTTFQNCTATYRDCFMFWRYISNRTVSNGISFQTAPLMDADIGLAGHRNRYGYGYIRRETTITKYNKIGAA